MKKNRNLFFLFQIWPWKDWPASESKDIIAVGQSETRAVSTPNVAGKVDLEMKMFLFQILYERHHIDEKCRPDAFPLV